MTTTAEALSAQAAQLPPAERMEVVERILDSLDQPDPTLDTLWAQEANDRLTAYRRGEFKAVALSDVIAKYQVAAQRACASASRPANRRHSRPCGKARNALRFARIGVHSGTEIYVPQGCGQQAVRS